MEKHVPLLTNTSETLRQSSPQLFHFADFLRRLGGWHQVAHFYYYNLFVCFDHYDFRRGLAAGRLRFGAGKEYQCSVSPAGASSAQLQRAGKQETEPQRLTLLSSTSAANASLTFPQKIQLHFQRCNKSPRGSRGIQTRNRA